MYRNYFSFLYFILFYWIFYVQLLKRVNHVIKSRLLMHCKAYMHQQSRINKASVTSYKIQIWVYLKPPNFIFLEIQIKAPHHSVPPGARIFSFKWKRAWNLKFFMHVGQRCCSECYLLELEVEISLNRSITGCIVSTLLSTLEIRNVSTFHFMQGRLPILPISISTQGNTLLIFFRD